MGDLLWTDLQRGVCNVSVYVDERRIDGASQHQSHVAVGRHPVDDVAAAPLRLSAVLRDDLDHDDAPGLAIASEPLQRRFEVMAYTTPCAAAVSFNGRRLSYGELDMQADALAVHLQERGLQPGSFCAIDLEPSLAQVRVVLAVLKAGAASLHVDANMSPTAAATAFAVLKPAFVFVRGNARHSDHDAALQTIACDEDAAELPFGWPNDMPIHAHTPAYAHATVSTDGDLCIVIRTHRSLAVSLHRVNEPALTGAPDPVALWRPLSSGALLTIPAPGLPQPAAH